MEKLGSGMMVNRTSLVFLHLEFGHVGMHFPSFSHKKCLAQKTTINHHEQSIFVFWAPSGDKAKLHTLAVHEQLRS